MYRQVFRRKVSSIFCGVLAAVVVTGCGGGSDNGATSDDLAGGAGGMPSGDSSGAIEPSSGTGGGTQQPVGDSSGAIEPVSGTGGGAQPPVGGEGGTPSAGEGGSGGGAVAGSGGAAGGDSGSGGGGATGGDGGTEGGGDVQSCLELVASQGWNDGCSQCVCSQCADAMLDCQDADCLAVVQCGRENSCVSYGCYCGASDLMTCTLGDNPQGACKDLLDEKSGLVSAGVCTSGNCLIEINDMPNTDPEHPVARATLLNVCASGQPAVPAFPGLFSGQEEVIGKCEAECGSARQ